MDRTGTGLGAIVLAGGLTLTAATALGGRHLLAGMTEPGADPGAVVAGCAAVAAALIAGWLSLCLLLALLSHLPGVAGALACRLRDRVTPALVRQWAAVVLGASVTVTVLPGTSVAAVREAPANNSPGWRPATPAAASTATSLPSPGWSSTDSAGPPVPDAAPAPTPGWTPRQPPARQQHDPHLLTGRQRTLDGDRSVVVRHGDSLWSIAAARLGTDATDGEISLAWPRWYAANTAKIGDDPHTLLPGMRLTPPTEHP